MIRAVSAAFEPSNCEPRHTSSPAYGASPTNLKISFVSGLVSSASEPWTEGLKNSPTWLTTSLTAESRSSWMSGLPSVIRPGSDHLDLGDDQHEAALLMRRIGRLIGLR